MSNKQDNNFQLCDKVTYDQEFNSYHFNKYPCCECHLCDYYTKNNLKHVFLYGFVIPVLWVYIIASYIFKYFLLKYRNSSPKLSVNITDLTQYELEEFKDTYFSDFLMQTRKNSSNDSSTGINQISKDYQEIYIKECVRDVFLYHEKVQKECSIWAWRSFSAIMVYICMIFMIVMCATRSISYEKIIN